MRKRTSKKLIDTNSHLRDPKARAFAIARMVQSSSAIEHIDVEIRPFLKDGHYRYEVRSGRKK